MLTVATNVDQFNILYARSCNNPKTIVEACEHFWRLSFQTAAASGYLATVGLQQSLQTRDMGFLLILSASQDVCCCLGLWHEKFCFPPAMVTGIKKLGAIKNQQRFTVTY